jgi:hypothetical protein
MQKGCRTKNFQRVLHIKKSNKQLQITEIPQKVLTFNVVFFKMAGWMQISWAVSSFWNHLSICSGWRRSKSASPLVVTLQSPAMPGIIDTKPK